MTKPEVSTITVPYRVCLLGEHVDHQGGRTLSANIDTGVTLEFRPDPDGSVFIEALDYGEAYVSAPGVPLLKKGNWTDYVKGVVQQFRSKDLMRTGFRGKLRGSFPAGGLSSSAAVQLAYAMAIMEVNLVRLSREELARLVVAAERSFVGAQVGLLDPMTILHADGSALLHLDCKDASTEAIAWPEGVQLPRFAVVYSGVDRNLATSPYNERTRQCREAAMALDPAAALLGDVAEDRRDVDRLPPILQRRAQHYFGEIDRVDAGIQAWRTGDAARFAELVNACGDSCQDNFDLGTAELINLVAWLREAPGVMCARFTGGGFGGSIVVMLEPGTADPITPVLEGAYAQHHPQAAARAQVRYVTLGAPAGKDSIFLK